MKPSDQSETRNYSAIGREPGITIPIYRPHFGGLERRYVDDCIDSTWISSRGHYIGRFESEFAEYVGIDSATAVTNGTVALHLAMMALGIGPGDEVIVPTLTYIASVNAITVVGATPVFVDSLRDTWQVDPDAIRRSITSRTKAVMVVHLYGASCDMGPIAKICSEHRLYLIEDCAEAFGTKYHGHHVGSFGDVGTFSFFGNKTITTGEGGMVVSKDKDLIQKVKVLKSQGVSLTREYWHEVVGFNYRMTNICAAIGVAQLSIADEILKRKRDIAGWYRKYLADVPVQFQTEPSDAVHSWWMFSILVETEASRDLLRNGLRIAGIETRPLFHPIHLQPPYQTGASFPIAEDLAKRGLNLPSYPDLREEDVAKISEAISHILT